MTRSEINAAAAELEILVDRTSLRQVVTMLAEIAFEKAAHIRENWQDEQLALPWNHAGHVLESAASKLKKETA